jgi:sugar O-acyltransferase (sialic acid O-acetyltransferase NeuD family)
MILGIYGGGELGREVFVLAGQINAVGKRWSELVFVDDAIGKDSTAKARVVTFDEAQAESSPGGVEMCIAVGEPSVRAALYDRIRDAGCKLATLIHPNVHIPKDTSVGPGTIICSGCFVSCGVGLSDNVLLQPSASVGHDCRIGSHSVISTFVSLGGKCIVGARTFIGMSVPVKEDTTIGDDVIVGMGSVVLRDIDSGMVALGNPARPMHSNDSRRVFRK